MPEAIVSGIATADEIRPATTSSFAVSREKSGRRDDVVEASMLVLLRRRRDPFRESSRERGPFGFQHTALGDQAGHQPRRRNVERIVRNRRALRHDPHRLDASIAGAAGHFGYFL